MHRERQILYNLTYVWNLKKKTQKKDKLIEKEIKLVLPKTGGEERKLE